MSDNLKVAKECGFHVYANTLGNTNNVDGTEHSLNTYTSRILALQQAAHDAEIAELRKEIAYAERCAVAQTEHAKTALEKLSAANAACAMKDEALKDIARGQLQVPDFEKYAVRVATDALSASPQQVAEWERKQIEPLLAQVAMLVEVAKLAEKEPAGLLKAVASKALTNTQATAEQFIAECEQRGAVKAHQEYMVIGALHKERFYAFPPFPEGSKLLFDRAASKKAG